MSTQNRSSSWWSIVLAGGDGKRILPVRADLHTVFRPIHKGISGIRLCLHVRTIAHFIAWRIRLDQSAFGWRCEDSDAQCRHKDGAEIAVRRGSEGVVFGGADLNAALSPLGEFVTRMVHRMKRDIATAGVGTITGHNAAFEW